MDSANSAAHEPPIFSTVLTPHRSLGRRGFIAVMTAVCALSFTAGSIFWAVGAWPVPGFMGLDVLLVYIAFRLNYRAARTAEEIKVTHERLTVRRIAVDGRATTVAELNPYWARLAVDRREETGVTRVRVVSHGRSFDVGAFLGPDAREQLATALAAALAAARATPAV